MVDIKIILSILKSHSCIHSHGNKFAIDKKKKKTKGKEEKKKEKEKGLSFQRRGETVTLLMSVNSDQGNHTAVVFMCTC